MLCQLIYQSLYTTNIKSLKLTSKLPSVNHPHGRSSYNLYLELSKVKWEQPVACFAILVSLKNNINIIISIGDFSCVFIAIVKNFLMSAANFTQRWEWKTHSDFSSGIDNNWGVGTYDAHVWKPYTQLLQIHEASIYKHHFYDSVS